ncbi:hypothetical protein Bca101_018612 [Brassica carinata]
MMLMNYRGWQVIAPLAHGSFITFYAVEAASLVQHLSSSFRLISLDQHAYATIDFWLKYVTMVVGFKTSNRPDVTSLFSVAEISILLYGSHIWRDVVCADVTSYFLLSGGLLSASRYHKLIERLISLQVQRSSTGFVVNQLKHYMLASPVSNLSAASGFLHFLKTDSRYVSAYWVTKQHEDVHRKSEEAGYTSLAIASSEWDWFSCLLLYLHIQLVDSVVLFSGSQAALLLHDLQWQQSFPSLAIQGLNRAFAITDHIIVAGSGWFKSILDLLYCSLPRPPEIPQFTWFSSPRCKFLAS